PAKKTTARKTPASVATRQPAKKSAAKPAAGQPDAKKTAVRSNGRPPAKKTAVAPTATKIGAKAPAAEATAKKSAVPPAVKKATAKAKVRQPLPSVPRKPRPGRKPVARQTPQLTPESTPGMRGPARETQPTPGPSVETVEVRRSWFSRRPLEYSRLDWSSGWDEHGRRLTRRRTTLVVTPLLLCLVAAAAYGNRLLNADPTPVAAQSSEVTCWDHTLALASDCSLPRWAAGLEWVFPSFDRSDDGCVNLLRTSPRHREPTIWTCTVSVRGRPVDITYSQLNSVATGLAHYEKKFGGARKVAVPGRDGRTARYEWRPARSHNGRWRLATLYADFPYAVQIEAATPDGLERASRYVANLRDPQHITVRTG
ncbi:MAG: hypothetical protein JWM79_1091, partial [Nocardioides sp.]|nr:hypothetical protein [Nocardioides sp.]